METIKAEIKAIKDDIIECKARIRELAPCAERLAIQQRLVRLEERLLNFENDLRNFKDESKDSKLCEDVELDSGSVPPPMKTGETKVDVAAVVGASFYIHVADYRGNAVAITPRKALTALHDKGIIGAEVTLIDHRGIEFNATVIFSSFVPLSVDIAVVELCTEEDNFPVFIPVCSRKVCVCDEFYVIGMTSGLVDDSAMTYVANGRVTGIEPVGSLFRSTYQCHDGLSGAGVIVVLEGGAFHVVGVHVGSHDDTVSPPPIKKLKGSKAADGDSVSGNSKSLANSIHGHTAYCLICEVQRVHDIENAIS